MAMDGPAIVRGLVDRGYTPVQAAALAGHMLQESGGDPTNVNPKEDAHGLLQWRLDRWKGLQDFARERGVQPTDPNLQLDFIRREFAGPEASAGKSFLSAPDLPSASAALKGYIRFGDNSDAVRLRNAQGLVGDGTSGGAGSAPASPTAVSSAGGIIPASPAEDSSSALTQLAAIPKALAQARANDVMPLQPMTMPEPAMTPAMIRARQIARAMISRPLKLGA